LKRTAALAIALLAAPPPAPARAQAARPAQSARPAQAVEEVPTFTAAVGLVRITVVVRDKAGVPVRGLKREDFQILL